VNYCGTANFNFKAVSQHLHIKHVTTKHKRQSVAAVEYKPAGKSQERQILIISTNFSIPIPIFLTYIEHDI
jgi:hypothetical protein